MKYKTYLLAFILALSPLFAYCAYEEYSHANILQLVKQFIPQNPVILEAGACQGEDTIKLSKQWPNGQIHSFEPHPHSFALLQERLKKNAPIANVTCYPLALNDKNGQISFYLNKRNHGSSSLLEASSAFRGVLYDDVPIQVKCLTLDDWTKEYGIKNIDFLWIDLEGAELKVLKSGKNILKTVQAIFTEVNFKEFRVGMTQYKDLKAFLTEQGFKEIWRWPLTSDYQGDALFVRA